MSLAAAEEQLRWQNLCLKFNNVAHKEACGVCGGIADGELGLEIFLEGTGRILCHECQVEYAPSLIEARDFYSAHSGPCPWGVPPEQKDAIPEETSDDIPF